MTLHLPRAAPPTVEDLVTITRGVAGRLADADRVGSAPVPGTAQLLHRGAGFDVLVRHWPAAAFEELHDDGGSVSAITVVSGELVEWFWSPDMPPPDEQARMTAEEITVGGPGPRRRLLAAGRSARFPAGHVHDLGCRYPSGATAVQAFAPPVAQRSYYATAGGLLRLRRTETFAPRAAAA